MQTKYAKSCIFGSQLTWNTANFSDQMNSHLDLAIVLNIVNLLPEVLLYSYIMPVNLKIGTL